MARPQGSTNKKLSKARLTELSIETLNTAMIQFIHKIKTESLSDQQTEQLIKLYEKFQIINDSK